MKVIKFAPGLIPVLKHQEHDQSSHGSWAGGSVSFKQDKNSLTMQDESGKTLASVDFVNLGNNRLDINSIDSFDEGKGYATKVLEKLYSSFPEHSIFWGKTILPASTHLAQKFSDKYGRTEFMPWGEGVIAGYEWGQLYGDTTVKKHQEHDQKTHGSWADGSQGSSSELSDDEIRDVISGSNTVNEMYQKVAERLGKSMKPKLEDLSEEEINFYRGVTDVDRDAQRLLDGQVTFTPFQTWGQGIYVSSEPDYAATYGDLIRLKLDKSAKLVEGEIAWSKAYDLFDKESSLDMPKILERIASGKMDNFSDSDIANIYWAAKGYDGYSAYATGRAEVVLFNADKLTVNKADIGAAVKKHQQHDQSSHGNWAEGSSGSALDAMPYEWKPEFKERLTAPVLGSKDINLGREQLQQVASSPIVIRVSSGDLELRRIVEAGRFMSLTELPEPTLGYEIDYREGRFDLEKGLWGLPTDSQSPIYGYFDTPLQPSVDNQTRNYGDVQIVLKDSVAGRTTISPGDSANHGLTPVLVTDARKGNLSPEQIDSAYLTRPFQRGATSVSQPISSVRTIGEIDYFEAQIHGGVKLSDIKSVRLESFSIVGDSTIALLKQAGIEVIRDGE